MKLDQFLKWKGIVSTGGEAKNIIISGVISVNGCVEKRRGRKLKPGDQVSFDNEKYIVFDTEPSSRRLAHSDE
tara:strand:- start:188 stop:406 length:219 start_codon:yes stop_codon:yes gene_type:complete